MLKLKRINEAKQVGTLYHVCTLSSALYNIEHNSITPSTAANIKQGKKTVSFTRDKLYIVDTVSLTTPMLLQFVIDGNKLSENYKVAPYADDYYSDEASEKEEVIDRPLTDLKKYTIGLNVLLIKDSFAQANPRIFKSIADNLEKMKSSGFKMEVLVLSGRTGTKIVKTNLPKDIDNFIALCRKIYDYDSPSIWEAMKSVSKQFFGKIADITDGKSSKINIEFKEDQPIKKVGEVINALVEIIQEELKSKKPTVSSSPNKEGELSLSKLLNSKNIVIESLAIYPIYDYMTNKTPIISLSLVEPDAKTMYINFPL